MADVGGAGAGSDVVGAGPAARAGGGGDAGRLELPHPRAHERAFVLVPWAAMAPDDELPGHGRVGDLAAHVDTVAERVQLVRDVPLLPPSRPATGGTR